MHSENGEETFIEENLLSLCKKSERVWHMSPTPPSLSVPTQLPWGRLYAEQVWPRRGSPPAPAPTQGLWYLPRKGRPLVFLLTFSFLLQRPNYRGVWPSVQEFPSSTWSPLRGETYPRGCCALAWEYWGLNHPCYSSLLVMLVLCLGYTSRRTKAIASAQCPAPKAGVMMRKAASERQSLREPQSSP